MEINEHQKSWTITQAELNLRWDLMESKITRREFDKQYDELKRQGLIKRNGKAVKE